jgi:hypothetical protein
MKRMTKNGLLLQGVAFVAVVAGTLVFRSSLCNLLFRCGCESMLAHASQFCNIHMQGMAHCPWCSHGSWGHNVPTGAILLSQAGVLFFPIRLSAPRRIGLCVAAFFVVGAAVGLLFAVFFGYPVFLGLRLS